jgi:hypothetical protein
MLWKQPRRKVQSHKMLGSLLRSECAARGTIGHLAASRVRVVVVLTMHMNFKALAVTN